MEQMRFGCGRRRFKCDKLLLSMFQRPAQIHLFLVDFKSEQWRSKCESYYLNMFNTLHSFTFFSDKSTSTVCTNLSMLVTTTPSASLSPRHTQQSIPALDSRRIMRHWRKWLHSMAIGWFIPLTFIQVVISGLRSPFGSWRMYFSYDAIKIKLGLNYVPSRQVSCYSNGSGCRLLKDFPPSTFPQSSQPRKFIISASKVHGDNGYKILSKL